MERKRKLPARAARVEGAPSKKRTSTTPDQQAQTPAPAIPPPVVEEPLPKSIAPGKPLPTVNSPQPENLPSSHFQSIPESGVLPESLNRSRQKWISEGIFEKYWTKVTKKKSALEQPKDNPPKDSMTKLGTCTITVEPHIFEATMYAIKDMTPRPLPQPMPRPILQYGPPGGMMPPPPPTPPPVQAKPIPPPHSTPQPSPKTQDVHMSGTSPATHNPPPPPSSSHPNGVVPNGYSSRPPPPPDPNVPPRYPPPHAMASASGPPPPPPQTNTARTDPVIQMLAERAATDSDLKGLMRIVANGEATPEELKKFQSHIDELTKLQKAREAIEPPRTTMSHPPPPPLPSAHAPIPAPQVNGTPQSYQTAPPPPPSTVKPNTVPPVQSSPAPPPPQPTVVPAAPFQAPQPQALRSKGPLPNSKPDICGVVFEFTGGNGDRYLFPKFSILEYPPGSSQVIASFLIIRKGSASDSPTYDPVLDYYQPITIRLYTHQGRQLEALQKVVAPQDEVRRYMDDVMDKCTRAEYVLLAMRLPRENDQPPVTELEDDVSKGQRMEGIQVNWATTNAPPPPPQQVKPVQRLLTEEEKYQSYIGTVAATG